MRPDAAERSRERFPRYPLRQYHPRAPAHAPPAARDTPRTETMQLTAAAPSPTYAAPAAPTRAPERLEVLAWMRERQLGGVANTEWVLDSRTGPNAVGPRFEVRRDDYALDSTEPFRSEYRFAHEVPPKARPKALEDVRNAAQLISSSAELAGLREVRADIPFFGRREQSGEDGANVAIGEGKILVRDGATSRAFVGDIDAMRGIFELVRTTVSGVLRA